MTDPIRPHLPRSFLGLVRGALSLLGRFIRFFFSRRLVWLPVLGLGAGLWAWGACTDYVPPGHVGLVQRIYGDGAGIQPTPLVTGLHFINPLSERLHAFPVDLQVLNFSDAQSEQSEEFRSTPSIKIQTSDGYQVQLDVSVLYRVTDAYLVFTEAGPGRAFEDRLIIPRADRILRKTLGDLNAEQFYQGPQRIEKSNAAHEQLAADLTGVGVQVEAVLVRRYVYDSKYQEIIESRKIKDQTVFLRQAEAKAAIEERKRDTIVSEGQATVTVELSRGESDVKKLLADAELYRRRRQSEGRLLVDLADAKGTQLENDALQGAGSENMVGLRMAEVLTGIKVLVLSTDGERGFNPLDLGAVLDRFEVK
ncbi:MAG: SPFH domain-containing protein [Myxococcales bacterium]|nr:SPFH domain-containing protein [Myxococcales bacterium]